MSETPNALTAHPDGDPTTEKKMNRLAVFASDESGATAIEYGLIAAGIGLTLVAVMPAIKEKLTATFTSVSGALS
jgi:pilus assembly protein Flp/PilA